MWGWIIFISIICLIVFLKMCQKNKICQLGFHDKVKVDTSIDCNKYIEKQMMLHKIFIGETDAFIDCHFRFIFQNIYSYGYIQHGANHKIKHDYICVKCFKCYNIVENEKDIINAYVSMYVDDMSATRFRKQMANDLYKEKCNEKF